MSLWVEFEAETHISKIAQKPEIKGLQSTSNHTVNLGVKFADKAIGQPS